MDGNGHNSDRGQVTGSAVAAANPTPAEATLAGAMSDRIQDEALLRVSAAMAPLRYALFPLAALVALMTRNEIAHARLVVGLVVAALAMIALNGAHHTVVRSQKRPTAARQDPDANVFGANGTRHRVTLAVAAALFGSAVVAGQATWIAAESSTDIGMLFALFPAAFGTLGAFMCAGRRDMFYVYLIPLALISSAGLWVSGNDQLRALAVLNLAFALVQVVLHRAATRSLVSSLESQLTTQALAVRLAGDQAALSTACERLISANTELTFLADHDPLTALYNRRGTISMIDEHLATCTSTTPVALLFCDLDRFKAVNDLLGHRGGDQFLTVLADRITQTLDAGSFAGRIGGDEFVMVLPGHDSARAVAVANRIVGVLAQAVHAEGRSLPSSVSIGVAVAPDHGTSSSDLLRNANTALYAAKHGGRNRVELFDGEMRAELSNRLESEQLLRRAIDSGEILPFFQPEIDATTGTVVGAELLARWLQPDGTVMNAAEFIGIARKAGLLERLTERVLAQARPDIRRLASFGLPDGFRFRVNLAPASTDRSWRHNPIDELVRGIDPNLITVDVREASVIVDLPAAAATLAAFRARGGRVCLNDFARGVSSLSMLRRLPVDEVRIDRVSIDTITAHPHDRAIVRSIIGLVREIGLNVTGDGVETGAQADALIALGCVRQQGHLYAPPMPAEQLETYLVDRQAASWLSAVESTSSWSLDELS